MKKKEENYYDTPSQFEPSLETKKYWRKSRKVQRQYGKTWFPGLFNTDSFGTDKLMFILIVVLELIGLYFLGSSVRWNGIIFYGFAIAVFMDFVCVFWSHAQSGTICENKNRQIIAKYEKDIDEYNRLWWKNFWLLLFTKYFADAFILIIAFGKIYFYLDAKGGINSIIDPITHAYDLKIIGVCFIYLLVFLLHIRYTGYAIHGFRLKRKMDKEYNRFLAAEHSHVINNMPQTTRFSENQINAHRENTISKQFIDHNNISILKETPQGDKAHYFVKNSDGSYTLYSWSVLKDDDLHSLSQMHQDKDKERLFLGIQGLKHQLNLMVSNPNFK